MSDTNHDKAAHGRHAAGVHQNTGAGQTQATPFVSPAPKVPPATAAMPPVRGGHADDFPLRYASDQAFPASDPFAYAGMAPAAAAVPARRHKPLKIVGIVLGVIVALLLVAYCGVALYFNGRFMPNSTIGGVDVSLMATSDAEQALANSVDDYKLSMTGQGFTLNLTAKDAGLSIDTAKVVQQALADVSPWAWPLELRRGYDATDKLVATVNDTGLDAAVRTAVEAFNATATPPANATVVYSSAVNAFVVQPEAAGTALNPDAVVKAADEAIVSLDSTVKLSADQLQKPAVLSTDERLKAAAASANTMITANLVLTMGGATVGEVNADLVSTWVVLGEDMKATLNEEALVAWVDGVVTACNTVGTTRTYTRPDGKVITVAGGPYGWEVDHDTLMTTVKDAVAAGSVQTVEVPTYSSGTAYTGAGAQDWGARYCDIDLAEQYVRFYDEAGSLIWESACISGTPNGQHDTPAGVYWLNSKASPSKLKGTNLDGSKYESTVQYWMPFVGNVIGMHDADWQPGFGGSMYANGYGSHGCVNLPPSAAAELYGIIQSGDVVVCHW